MFPLSKGGGKIFDFDGEIPKDNPKELELESLHRQGGSLKNIVALLAPCASYCSLFLHLVLLAESCAGGALGLAHVRPKKFILNMREGVEALPYDV